GLEAAERDRAGIKSLRVGYNRVFGYYIEVSHANQGLIPDGYIRKQTLTGAERYITPELKERETVVLNAQQDRVTRELEVLKSLARLVADAAEGLLATTAAARDLHGLAILAETAADAAWRRPGA